MIHVCYAVSDKKGTYTKFAGTSICSLFEHTKEWVTVHFLHDHTLSTDNRRYLMQMVRSYGQQILFYDVEKIYRSRLLAFAEQIRWMEEKIKTDLTQASWYRLLLGEVLSDVKRCIYLDADTIINLDIAELWAEDTGANGLAAVRDLVSQEGHYSAFVGMGLGAEERYFNSGVLLLDLDKFRKQEKLLERGADFLEEHELVDYPDQDILNHFFGEDCCLLQERYNTLVAHEMIMNHDKIDSCIYHYAGQKYAIAAENNFYRLFLDYLTKTPWCNAEFISNLARNIGRQARSIMMGYSNCVAGMRRIVIGAEDDEGKIRELLKLKEDEAYYTLKAFNKRGFQLERNEIMLFFLNQEEFVNVKKHLEACGCKEGIHFLNGGVFLYRDASQDARILRES